MVAKVKERSLIWDNYKGILIFLVVFAHFLYAHSVEYPSGIVHKVVTFIYLFHMPAFVFISGYFGKSERSHSFESIIRLIFCIIFLTVLWALFTGFLHLLNRCIFIGI